MIKKSIILAIMLVFSTLMVNAQSKYNRFLTPDTTFNKPRFYTAVTTVGVGFTASMIVLYDVWYKDAISSKFQFINDNDAWMQVDKFGHAFTAYAETKAGIDLLKWTGTKRKKAILWGGLTGTVLQTSIEIFDGYTDDYGFSTGDIVANTTGSLIALGQELAFDDQILIMKFSSHLVDYDDDLKDDAKKKFGTTFIQRSIKDYNGQTYWFSVNLKKSLGIQNTRFPAWLNVAYGYGADKLESDDKSERERQHYLSLDVDLTKIKTKSRTLKVLFGAFNTLKVPFPSLEYNTKQKWKANPLHF